MSNKILILGLFSLMSFNAYSQEEDVYINEILALNETILADEDGDYSDWIELYNSGTGAVDLSGWFLSDDSSDTGKWSFPDVEITPGEFLVIFASGKDRSLAGGELHSSFKLSGAGEYLGLFNPVGEVVSAFDPSYPVQQTDISYGFLNGTYVSFGQPSPGAENIQEGALLPPPLINVDHGIYELSFDLEITTGYEGAEIFYSLDGSIPDIVSGHYYSSPLHVDTSTILRAVLVLDDTQYSEVITRSYIFLDDVIRQPNNPKGYPSAWGPYTVLPGNSIADYEMDPEMMADPAYAATVKAGLASLPTLSLVTDIDNLFSTSTDPETGGIYIYTGPPLTRETDGLGKGWERPASLEYFNTEGTESFQVNCGVRIQGGHSRRPEKSPKHSFRITFRSEYGPSKLKYPLFQDADANTTFDNLVLRAGFGLSWIHHSDTERSQAQYQQDIWSKDTQRAMGHPSSHSEYAHLYLNGIYWGIYAPSERMDNDFSAYYMDGDPDDFDVIKDYQDVINGEITSWNKLFELANAGLETNDAYQQIQGNNPDGSRNPQIEPLLDVVNLADYMLINFYGSNTDWDHHNWVSARNRVNPGKGFNFFSWDAEHLLKSVNGNVLDLDNDNCPSRLFQQLRQNEDFRRLFADRIQRFCYNDGLLTPGSAAERWNVRTNQVEGAIPVEAARWGDYRRDVHPYQTQGPFALYNYENYWLSQRDYMTSTYFPQRTNVFLTQLRSAGLFPALDAPSFFVNGTPYPGIAVEKGDEMSMTSKEGVIYYTSNGSDPVDWGFSENGNGIEFITREAAKTLIVPKNDMGGLWQTDKDYDDSAWEICTGSPGGIGYEKEAGYQDLISFDVSSEMYDSGSDPNNSCYIRIPFSVEAGALDELAALYLEIRYDDGFAAFLNGVRVAEANAPFELLWNSASEDSHEADVSETFNISEHIGLLSEGENLLAIQALNLNTSSSDFLFMLEMKASDQISSGISAEAIMYDGAWTLDRSSHIMARTRLDDEWSAMASAFAAFDEDYLDIKVTEVNYNPQGTETIPGGEFEFIELKNTGESTLDLGGMSFVEGLDYTFPSETELLPGGFVVLASDELSFAERYGFFPDADYKGSLNNGGELIQIKGGPGGETLISLLYDDQEPWPVLADGAGHSLVPLEFNPTGDPNVAENWRKSYFIGGSPGRDDTESTGIGDIVAGAGTHELLQNYPNPFNELTYIAYNLSGDAEVELSVYNLVGQKITVLQSGWKEAGHHVLSWNGSDDSGRIIEEGVYFYRIVVRNRSGNFSTTRKMIRM